MEEKGIFRNSFIPWIVKWGRGLNLLGVLLCFGPCIALAIMGYFPPWSAFAAALAIQLPTTMSAWFYEPISYFAVLGIPGSYMAFLSGNISNLRVPASAVAQEAAGVQEGSDEGTIVATIGIAVSTFVNIVILTIGVMGGAYILAKLPPAVTAALNLLLPALFAALLAKNVTKNPKLALVGIPLGCVMVVLLNSGMLAFLGKLATPAVVLTCVFGTMGTGIAMAKKSEKK